MKKIVLGVVGFLLVMLLCSCSGLNKTPNKEQILSDYLAKDSDTEYANFTAIEIKRSQLDKDEKTFIADISLTGKDEYADYICFSSIQYNYYDDQGWMLDQIVNSELTILCHTGRTLKELEKDIRTNYTAYIPGGIAVENFGVEDYLDQNMQLVTFTCAIANKQLITEYDVSMYFRYANGNWFIDHTEKNPTNFKMNLQGTLWETNTKSANTYVPMEFAIKIKKISDDSRTIVIEYKGNDYEATLNSNYTEESFNSLLSYTLNKPIYTKSYSVWDVNYTYYIEEFGLNCLTGHFVASEKGYRNNKPDGSGGKHYLFLKQDSVPVVVPEVYDN